MKLLAVIILSSLLLQGCFRKRVTPFSGSRESQLQLETVVTQDGVDAREALVISTNYYWRFIGSQCGGAGQLQESEKDWVIPIMIGVAGVHRGDIRISKSNGRVSYSDGPTIDDPGNIWKTPSPPYLRTGNEAGIVQPGSHDSDKTSEISRIDMRIDEINKVLKADESSSTERRALKREKKALKKRKSGILLKEVGIDPKVKGPVTYENQLVPKTP